MDVVLALLLGENLLEWGGGLEEGGQKIRPGGRVADFFGGRRYVLDTFGGKGGLQFGVRFRTRFGVPCGMLFGYFLEFFNTFWEPWGLLWETFGELSQLWG